MCSQRCSRAARVVNKVATETCIALSGGPLRALRVIQCSVILAKAVSLVQPAPALASPAFEAYENPDHPVVGEFRSLVFSMVVAVNDRNIERYIELRTQEAGGTKSEAGVDASIWKSADEDIRSLIDAFGTLRFDYLKIEGDAARLAYSSVFNNPHPDLVYAACYFHVMFRRRFSTWRVDQIGGSACYAQASPGPGPHSSVGREPGFALPSDW